MKAVPKLDESESGLIMVFKKLTEPILMPELQKCSVKIFASWGKNLGEHAIS